MKNIDNDLLEQIVHDLINDKRDLLNQFAYDYFNGKFEAPKNVTMSNEEGSFAITAGIYWDPFSEMFPFATKIVSSLINNGSLQGKTIINLISTQYSGIKTLKMDNKKENYLNVIDINTPKLEKIKNKYLKCVDVNSCKEYDNIVCAVIDDPTDTDYPIYDCYIKNSILIVSKDKSYIINVGYPSKKVDELNTDDLAKKMRKYVKN